jgi:glycosyltransferase involved in cell wall biosynthesis
LQPLIVTVHGAFGESYLTYSKLQRFLTVSSLRCASKVIAVSERVAADLRLHAGTHSGRLAVLPAYFAASDTNRRLAFGERSVSVVAAGNGTRIYRFEDVLRAVETSGIPGPVRLFIYGHRDEKYLDEIEQLVGAMSRAQVIYDSGRATFVDVLRNAKVFVRPTTQDGDSVAVREAVAAGCVVLASDVAERPEGCLLFTATKVAEMSTLMQDVFDSPPLERAAAGGAAVADYIAVYQSVLAKL